MRKTLWTVVVLVALSGLALAADPPSTAVLGGPESEAKVSPWCTISGVWLETQPGLGSNFLVLTPLDRWEWRLALDIESIDMDATFFGMFPGATYTHLRGTAQRLDRSRVAYSGVNYAVGDQVDPATGTLEILYISTLAGEFTIADDCSSLTPVGAAGFYAPWQDPFGDEEPLYGCYPVGGGTIVRVPDWSPCALEP